MYVPGEKKKMQLRVTNHVPTVRKKDSFFLPLVGIVSKRLW